MKQIVLGFGNKARHGKDTVASVISNFCRESGIPVKVLPFAEALRREVTEAITNTGNIRNLLNRGVVSDDGQRYIEIPSWVQPSPNPDLSDPLLPHGKHSLLLQWWGTEYRRAQDPNYWVKKFRAETANFPGVVIAQDARFANEVKTIKEMGGVTVNVTRLNADGTPFRDPGRDPNHPSETELDGYNWDYRLVAHTGEIAWLEYQALNLFDYIYTRIASEPAKVVEFITGHAPFPSGFKAYYEVFTSPVQKAA